MMRIWIIMMTALIVPLITPIQLSAKPVIQTKIYYVNRARIPIWGSSDATTAIKGYLNYATAVKVINSEEDNWYWIQALNSKIQGWTRGFYLTTEAITNRSFNHVVHRYQIGFPDGWHLEPLNDDFIYIKPPSYATNGPVAISVQVAYATQDSLEKAAQTHPISIRYQRNLLEKEGKEKLLFIRQEKEIEGGDLKAQQLHFFLHDGTYLHANEDPSLTFKTLEGHQYLFLRNGKIYALTVVAPKSSYHNFQSAFERTIDSFRLLDPDLD